MGQRFLGIFPQVVIVGSFLVTSCALSSPPSPSAGGPQAAELGIQGGIQPQRPTPEMNLKTPIAQTPPSQTMGQVTISMQNLKFAPQTVTVSMGTTVVWVNNDPQGHPHTSTSDTGLWDSGRMNVGKTYSRTFDKAGTYPYRCTFHQDQGMVGTIIVK